MITVSSFAIGSRYITELDGLLESVKKRSPDVNMMIGIGMPGSNKLHTFLYEQKIGQFAPRVNTLIVPIDSELICNWNNIGFIKAYWMLHVMKVMQKNPSIDGIQLWIDADARVRGDLRQLTTDLGDANVGMVVHCGEHWLNGTIAVRNIDSNIEWLQRWWNKCVPLFRPVHDDWRLNDQIVMRNMMIEGDKPDIIDLGEKWASLPPELVGDKKNPPKVRPRMENALIHHWQASRAEIKGWNWPPKESERYPDETD